jgi:hypothetical protein
MQTSVVQAPAKQFGVSTGQAERSIPAPLLGHTPSERGSRHPIVVPGMQMLDASTHAPAAHA